MEPSYGKTGSKGTIRVWNKTNGYLDVSKEGHLLMGQTAAWVEETDEIVALIDGGLLEVLEGQLSKVSSASSDENSKKKKSLPTTDQPPLSSGTENLVVAVENKKDEKEIVPSNNDVSVKTV
jgi:hypothetical protein